MIDETGSHDDERLGRLIQVFDGRKWPVVKAVDVYIRPVDNVQKVSQTVVTELGLRKWRLNKYTLAIGTTHGHVVAFLKGTDVVLKAFSQCLAKEKCILLIKKPSQGSKKLFKTKLNMSDTQLYTQDRCTGKLIENKTSSTQNMFQYPLVHKDKNQNSRTYQAKKSFVPIPELGIFTPEQHVLHSGTFAQHCHLGDVRNNNSSDTIHNVDHSMDSSLDDSASSYGFSHSNSLLNRASQQKYDDIYHSCVDLSKVNNDARTDNSSRIDSIKRKPILEEDVKLDPGMRSCSLSDMKSVSARTCKGPQTLFNHRQKNPQMLQSGRDNLHSNSVVNRADPITAVNNYNCGDCNYESQNQKKNLPTKPSSNESKMFSPPSGHTHTSNHHLSSETRSNHQPYNGYRSYTQHCNADQYNAHQSNTDQYYGRDEKRNSESSQKMYIHENTESKQSNPKVKNFPENRSSSATNSSTTRPSNGHHSVGFVLQRSESIIREESPMKPKRSLPNVPASNCSDRVKKLTELMKSRMAVRSSSQPKIGLDGSHTYQRRLSSGSSNLDYENLSPINQSVNKIYQSDFVKRANGLMVGYMYRTGPDLDYSQKEGNGNWVMQNCNGGEQVRAEPYVNRWRVDSSNVLPQTHVDKDYFDQSENGNFLQADHSSDSAHTSATSASVLDSGYTTNSESDYMNQQELPVFHPLPLSQYDYVDSNGNRQDYPDTGSVSSPKFRGFQNCNTLDRKQSNLLNTHRFGSVQNISSAQAHGSPKDSRGYRNSRQLQGQGNFKELNNSTNTIYYPERQPHQFQTHPLPEEGHYSRSTQSMNNQDPKQYLQPNQPGNGGQCHINKPVVIDRYREVNGALCDRHLSNTAKNSHTAPGDSPTDSSCSYSSHWSKKQKKISLFEVIQKYDLIPVHIRLPQQISLMSLLSLKEFPVSRVTDISPQNKPANIGGPCSAFTPVRNTSSQDSQPATLMVGLHNVTWDIHKYSSLGALEIADLIVEVNGTSCLDATLEQLELILRRCSGNISLTVARSKEANGQIQAQRIKSLEAEISRLDDILQAREEKIQVLRKANHFKDSFHHIDGELIIAGLELGEDEYVV